MRMMIEPKDCGHETHLWMLMTTMVITPKKKKMVMMTVTKIVGEGSGGETLGCVLHSVEVRHLASQAARQPPTRAKQ